MSFDNIQLPSSVLSGLYKQVVVTDDYAQVGGNSARKVEEIAAPVNTVPAADKTADGPGSNTGSGPLSTTTVVETPSVIAAQPAAPQSPTDSGWSTAPSTPSTPPEDAASYRFLGKNAKQVAIIVYSPADAYLPDDQLQLLTKMLDACKLNLGDVAIINQASQPVHFTQLATQLHSQKTLLFGIQPEQIGLPLSFPAYKEQEYAGCTYLLANPLGDLTQTNEEGKALKGKLWGCLKKMFNI